MIHATETGKSIAAQYISIVCPTCFYIFLVNILILSFNIQTDIVEFLTL